MTDGPTKHLVAALQIHRETVQELDAAFKARDDASRPFSAGIRDAEAAIRAPQVQLDRLIADRDADDAYRAANHDVTEAVRAVAVEDSNVKAEAISLRHADTIKGNIEIEGYVVRPRVSNGIEITDAAEFTRQVNKKLPALLDVLTPRMPVLKVVKDHAATLAQLEISGWKRTKKVSATFQVLGKEADGTTDTDA